MKRLRIPRFLRSNETVVGAAFVIATLSIASRALGVVRDRILASTFGAGQTLDVYYAAFRLPDLVFNLLVLGALSAGFIPIFASLMAKNESERAWRLTNNVLNILGVALAILCSLGILAAPMLIRIIAPGFEVGARETIASLTRIMFLSPFLLGLSCVVGSVLQSKRRFFVYSLSPIFYNFGIIAGALWLAPHYGVTGLAWGVVIGSAAHLLIQVPEFFRVGFRFRAILEWKDRSVRAVFAMMTARTFGLAVTQLNLMAITIIASGLPSGSLTVFNLANNLQSFPVGIFGISFAVAAFPLMSSAETTEKIIALISRTFRQVLFFIIPATVLILSLRAQIVRVILGSGKFDWQATLLTIDTLGFFVISLFAQAALPLLARAFYAQHDSKTPLFTGLGSEAINITLALILSKKFGAPGLALAFSSSAIFNFLMQFILLHRKLGGLDEKRLIRSTLKFSVAALFAALAVQSMKLLVWPYADMTRFWGVLLQAGTAGLFGLVIYFALCSLLKSEELLEMWSSVRTRVFRKRGMTVGDSGEARGI